MKDSQETQEKKKAKKKKRLLSLDVLRGITVAGMILVNNPGTWSKIYAPLRHAAWNGLTPTDLVFPFFVFCMGVAMYISYSKYNFQLDGKSFIHLFTRGVLIILIGWALSWYGMFLRQITTDHTMSYALWYYPVAHLRFPGVLPRLGIVSIIAALLLLTVKPKNVLWVSGGFLVLYSVAQAVTHSFELSESNMESMLDLLAFGDNHIYHIKGVPLDPEGILSTIPCVAHALIGVWVGSQIFSTKDMWTKVTRLLLPGAIMLIIGFCLDYAFPINKALWSASYTLVTCGLASCLLGILMWLIDIRLPEVSEGNIIPQEEREEMEAEVAKQQHLHPDMVLEEKSGRVRTAQAVWLLQDIWDWIRNHWFRFFEAFGVNPLFIFVLSGVLVNTMNNIRFMYEGEKYSVWSFYYHICTKPVFGEYGGSLVSALSLIFVMWIIAYILYRKKIYIKL